MPTQTLLQEKVPPAYTSNSATVEQATPQLRKWTAEEYIAMLESGLLAEGPKVELLNGQIVEKMGNGSLHDYVLRFLNTFIAHRVGLEFDFGNQSSANIAIDSLPEPDFWISNKPPRSFKQQLVSAADIVLVIEVSDSSLQIDRGLKATIYASAGIAEYWVVNVVDQQLECFTEPQVGGAYAQKQTFKVGHLLQHQLLRKVDVTELFA